MTALTYTILPHPVVSFGKEFVLWRVTRSDGMQLTEVAWGCDHDLDVPPSRAPFNFGMREEAESFVRLSAAGVFLHMIPMPISPTTGTRGWEWAPAVCAVPEN